MNNTYVIYQPNSTAKGCAFVKIGNMLQELGVLPPREDEKDQQIKLQLSYFNNPKEIEAFSQSLLKIGVSKETTIKYLHTLKKLSLWLFQIKKKDLNKASSYDLKTYMELLCDQHPNHYIRPRYHIIKRYYRWLLLKGIIDNDPTPELNLNREKGKINILDDCKVKQLFSFIRNTNSNPEQALMIALTLIWGTKTIDLAHAQIILQDPGFDIKFRRKELTKGKKYYNRQEILKLPKENKWFFDLQKRYLSFWQDQYNRTKKTYPKSPLFLHKTFHCNRLLSTDVIRNRFKEATKAATGIPISNRIIRQTCGHLNSSSGDASLLATLGWSDQFAFHYTWLPREIWSK